MAVQIGCGIFLLWDMLTSVLGLDTAPVAWVYHEIAQLGAVVGLILGAGASAALLYRSVRRQRAAESSLRLAQGAFMDVLEERFAEWQLTPAERDVALFSVKGFSIAEIAQMRDTSQGTVKAQTNAIYRKAGVSGRPQLLSLFIDALMEDGQPILPAPEAPPLALSAPEQTEGAEMSESAPSDGPAVPEDAEPQRVP